MAATSKLIVYNDALRELGSHPLANLTTANTRLQELDGAFSHAVEYVLSRVDWNFARRRSALTGTADTSFSPYSYRYARPTDYLRKLWIKLAAGDEFQIEHTETGAVIYGFEATALMEYISDHADNYDPANWPPHFTRCIVLYLAMLVGPKLARAIDANTNELYQKLDMALADAERAEAVYANNSQIPTNRHPVMRRALEMMGQQIGGSVAITGHVDQQRWAMQKAWDSAVRYVLEQAAWNFATKRALLTLGAEAGEVMPGAEIGGIVEGYSVDGSEGNAETPFDNYAFAGFRYAWYLPEDYLHKIWLKPRAEHEFETHYQLVRDAVFTNEEPCVLEYIAEDDWTTSPDNWPETVVETVAARLAMMIAPELSIEKDGRGRQKVTAPQVRERLEMTFMRALADAKIKDAIQQEPKTLPLGRFARARMGSIGSSSIRRCN